MRLSLLHRITVCSKCLRASCWQGVWVCSSASDTNRAVMSYGDLEEMGREHEHFWTRELAEINMATTRKMTA